MYVFLCVLSLYIYIYICIHIYVCVYIYIYLVCFLLLRLYGEGLKLRSCNSVPVLGRANARLLWLLGLKCLGPFVFLVGCQHRDGVSCAPPSCRWATSCLSSGGQMTKPGRRGEHQAPSPSPPGHSR